MLRFSTADHLFCLRHLCLFDFCCHSSLSCLLIDSSVDFSGNHGLLTASGQHRTLGNEFILFNLYCTGQWSRSTYENVLPVTYSSLYLVAKFTIWVLQVVAGIATIVHQRQVTVVGYVKQLKQGSRFDVGTNERQWLWENVTFWPRPLLLQTSCRLGSLR